ncbi:MAG: hypothetical protein KDK66_03770 [Deltaproteobacteria bacterium]|nr:hypothetical protein [Deltaproteobacteria bacterium]
MKSNQTLLKIIFLPLVLVAFFLSTSLFALPPSQLKGKGEMPKAVQVKLRGYMGKLGGLFASVQIDESALKSGEGVDWDTLGIAFKEMEDTLKEIRSIKEFKNYDAFFGQLESDLRTVKGYQIKKNPKVFDAFNKMTNTCFSCHALYRPENFLTQPNHEKTVKLFQGGSQQD